MGGTSITGKLHKKYRARVLLPFIEIVLASGSPEWTMRLPLQLNVILISFFIGLFPWFLV